MQSCFPSKVSIARDLDNTLPRRIFAFPHNVLTSDLSSRRLVAYWIPPRLKLKLKMENGHQKKAITSRVAPRDHRRVPPV